jgi:hypothetical protein
MPQGRSGLTSLTAPNMVLDAGSVYLNIDLTALEDASASDPWADAIAGSTVISLGGTRGGNVYRANRTIRQMPVDGAIGPVKGFARRQTVAPTLTTNLVEVTDDNLIRSLAGANSSVVGSFTKVTGGEIEDTDYITNVALATTLKGADQPFVIVLQNCLVLESPEMSFTDENELVMAVTFTAHVLSTAPNTEAAFIYHPTV